MESCAAVQTLSDKHVPAWQLDRRPQHNPEATWTLTVVVLGLRPHVTSPSRPGQVPGA